MSRPRNSESTPRKSHSARLNRRRDLIPCRIEECERQRARGAGVIDPVRSTSTELADTSLRAAVRITTAGRIEIDCSAMLVPNTTVTVRTPAVVPVWNARVCAESKAPCVAPMKTLNL
jgi:hypothetical protein